MAEEAFNPYTPPAELAPPPPEPTGTWAVQGEHLLVRSGARLPEVDLEGQGGVEELVPALRSFIATQPGSRGMIAAWVPITVMFAWMAFSRLVLDKGGLLVGAGLSALTSWLLGRKGTTGGIVPCSITGYCSLTLLRKRAKRGKWLGFFSALGWAMLLSFLAGMTLWDDWFVISASSLSFELVFGSIILAAILILVPLVVKTYDRTLRCTGYQDGWFHLRGVSFSSLARFSTLSNLPSPEPRMRTVYKVFQHRLPLANLTGKHRWNPRVLLILSILKAKRSPKLERLFFHRSEITRNPASAASPSLLERWQRESTDSSLATWTALYSERHDSPQGDMRTNVLILASPDRKHFADVVQFFVSNNQFFEEKFVLVLRSRTEDGRCFYTSTQPVLPFMPENSLREHREGSVEEVYRAHLARLGSIPLRAIHDDGELRSVIDAETDAEYELFESLGIQTPAYEMELADELPVHSTLLATR